MFFNVWILGGSFFEKKRSKIQYFFKSVSFLKQFFYKNKNFFLIIFMSLLILINKLKKN